MYQTQTINSQRYQTKIINDLQIQSECLAYLFSKQFILANIAPAYASKLTKQFLEIMNISILDWPAYFVDTSLIKNLWDSLKRKIAEDGLRSSTEL